MLKYFRNRHKKLFCTGLFHSFEFRANISCPLGSSLLPPWPKAAITDGMSQGLRIHRKWNWKTPYGSCTMLMSSTFFYTKQSGLPEVGIEDGWVIRTFNCRCSMQQLPSKYCNKCTPYCNQRQNNLSIFYRSTRNSTAWECYWPINRGNGSIFSRKLPKRNPLIDRFDHRYVVLPPLEMFSLPVLL